MIKWIVVSAAVILLGVFAVYFAVQLWLCFMEAIVDLITKGMK